MNLVCGLRKSLQYAAVGFAIPATVVGSIAMSHLTFHDIHPMDRENDLARLPTMILVPSLGLAVLFGLAAFASFTPRNGLSFIRALIAISAATLIGVAVTRPQMPRKTRDPNAWTEISIPLATALIATIVVLFFNERRPSQPKDGDEPITSSTTSSEITMR